jgi:hypothetical protein
LRGIDYSGSGGGDAAAAAIAEAGIMARASGQSAAVR